MTSSALSNAVAFLKGELEVTLVPVLIGALQVFQKSPNALGAAAAEAYVLGNAPAALAAAETSLIQTSFGELSTLLTSLQTAGAAAVAKGV